MSGLNIRINNWIFDVFEISLSFDLLDIVDKLYFLVASRMLSICFEPLKVSIECRLDHLSKLG